MDIKNTWKKFREWMESDTIPQWFKRQDWVNIIVYLSVLGIFTWDMKAGNVSNSTKFAPIVALFILRAMLWEKAYREKIELLVKFGDNIKQLNKGVIGVEIK